MIDLYKAIASFQLGKRSDEISTVSTIGALMEGVYQGVITCKELLKRGDFGLGTFDSLDGEMIVFDNQVYRADMNGDVKPASPTDKVAYAAVKNFQADKKFDLTLVTSVAEFGKRLDSHLGLPNAIVAVKAFGYFDHIQLRSMPKQEKPYAPLVEVAKHQSVFKLNDVKGTLVGFRFPAYTGEVGVNGFHFHFLSLDRQRGGQVLELILTEARVECDISRELHALLPDSTAFDQADLDVDHAKAIKQLES